MQKNSATARKNVKTNKQRIKDKKMKNLNFQNNNRIDSFENMNKSKLKNEIHVQQKKNSK